MEGYEGYTHDSIMQGNDSVPYIYKKRGSKDVIHFHKEYCGKDYMGKTLRKNELIFYHMLHRFLSKETITLEYKQTIFGKEYEGVKISILDLDPEDVCDATIVDTKQKIRATNPKYIAGKYPQEFADEVRDSNPSGKDTIFPMWVKIKDAVYEHANEALKSVLQNSKDISHLRVEFVNIKVVPTKDDDNYLHVVVTDLGASITGLIRFNNIKVKEAKQLLVEALEKTELLVTA